MKVYIQRISDQKYYSGYPNSRLGWVDNVEQALDLETREKAAIVISGDARLRSAEDGSAITQIVEQ